jgi:hypothetical protein
VVVSSIYFAEQHPALFAVALFGAMFLLAWGIHRIGWLRRSDGLSETYAIVVLATFGLWWVWALVAFLVWLVLGTDVWPF